MCSLVTQRAYPSFELQGRRINWIRNDKKPGTHEIGKVDILSCIIQSSLSCIIFSISCLLLLIIIIVNSKLTSEMIELEEFILSFLDNFRN